MKMKVCLLVAFCFLLTQQTIYAQYNLSLENGDFLLISASGEGISQAIDRVTKKDSSTHYSHIALVEKDKDGYWVLHAAPKNGTERIPLETFIKERAKDDKVIDVYRLKEAYAHTIPEGIEKAKTMLGLPYNFSYILSDEAYYCSDFVERCFEKYAIFSFEPMTFVNPETGEIDAVWESYYRKQNLAVPEGKPGCNPNGMAASEKLIFVGGLQVVTKVSSLRDL